MSKASKSGCGSSGLTSAIVSTSVFYSLVYRLAALPLLPRESFCETQKDLDKLWFMAHPAMATSGLAFCQGVGALAW